MELYYHLNLTNGYNMNQIGEIQKNSKEKIIVSVNEYEGHTYVDLRVYYEDTKTEEYKPTKKGIALSKKNINEIIVLLKEASGII